VNRWGHNRLGRPSEIESTVIYFSGLKSSLAGRGYSPPAGRPAQGQLDERIDELMAEHSVARDRIDTFPGVRWPRSVTTCSAESSGGAEVSPAGARRVEVSTLLDRWADGDVAEAEAATERLATAPTDDGLAVRDI